MAEAPQIRREVIRIGLGAVIALWLGSKAAAGVWWLARHPSVWLAAGACWGLWWLDAAAGVWAPAGVAAGVVAVVVVWRYAHPGSFPVGGAAGACLAASGVRVPARGGRP